ncbi:MAG: hypothetical protein PHV33_06605 [Elusimicrobiales bacterium]|nr:hypothetical protein [Elusimicrobiales bacterium]
MKNFLLTLLLLSPCAALAADDCARSADACSAGAKRLSPFAAASLSEPRPAAVAAAKKAELKQAPAPKEAPAAAAQEVSTAAAPAPAVPARQDLSSPAWLVFVAGALAGLYFYLRGGSKRGRRK